MSSSAKPAFAAVVLAAGNSSRLGQPKQLLRWQGKTLLTRTIELAQSAGPEHCILALGGNAEPMWQSLIDTPKPSIDISKVNRLDVANWQLGMGASLQASVRAVIERSEISGLLILLVDQYKVAPKFVQQLVQCWHSKPNFACCARYRQLHGVPAILPRAWFADILVSPPNENGARHWLRSRADVLALDLDDPGDLDQSADINSETPQYA
jgi:molybdenum cofactor cytidylyltransferase